MTGILILNQDRPDIVLETGIFHGGLHCGDCFCCLMDDEWIDVRLEYDTGWVLVHQEKTSQFVMVCEFECRCLSNYKFIRLLQELCRDRTVQMPCNIHRSGTLMLHIVGCSQIGVCLCATGNTIRFELTDEQ